MPWLPCYVSGDDTSILLSFLNQSDDVAFIVADGDGRWKAVFYAEWVKAFPGKSFGHCQIMRKILPNNVPRILQKCSPIDTSCRFFGKCTSQFCGC